MEETKTVKKRGRDEYKSPESAEMKRLRENLLNTLDDDPDICASNQDLDLFMKSFEDEITVSTSAALTEGGVTVLDFASDSGESRPNLGYLLEASDDDLGIPPPAMNESMNELVRIESEFSELGGKFGEEPGYDAFGSGFGEADTCIGGGYEAIDGLFEYSNLRIGSGDYSWRPETLPTGPTQ